MSWTNGYDVTNRDVDGDRLPDYRMPPIWEYGTRKASMVIGRKVSPDLALVTRYVGAEPAVHAQPDLPRRADAAAICPKKSS